ncbi:hypothetical protein [Caulobacter endophyticus]|uniref:Uncharacterized protein n=1 Tax=Caulobacter endophyticus TaxID=2172652 RepID=A0A2T9K3Y8_9CAUL|nr:hypothetical protein [Caulobacter endophyticus]PVM90654.1 hypothetical protein DDF67_09490 [Caulobacter endophyticus]
MATVHIVLANVQARARTGATMPVPDSVPSGVDTVASAAASTQSTLAGAAGQFWSIVSTGAVWVNFGPNPVAGSDAGWLVPAGVPRDFAVTADGEKIAVKDV